MQNRIQASPVPETGWPRLEAALPPGSLFVPYSHGSSSEQNVTYCETAICDLPQANFKARVFDRVASWRNV
jgi:hypothetical protein